ncbi:hypothetical protein MBLNU13_g03472t1 [Cladosporium sp. NU13]
MHLTTIVSLLAVGAAAAPAAKSWDLNTRVPMPTGGLEDIPKAPEVTNLVRRQDEGEETPADPSSSSSSSSTSSSVGLIGGILGRRQQPAPTGEPKVPAAAAEKDPLDAYLGTLDGDYDEQKSEAALNHYHDSLDKDESTVTTSTTVAAKTPVPETVNSTAAVETKKNATIPFETEKNSTVPAATKNETSSAAAESTGDDSLDSYLSTLDGEYDDEKSEAALNHYHDSLEEEDENTATTTTVVAAQTPLPDVEAKNETSSAAPEPTKKAASKDPLTRLNDALPLKRQEFPEKPDAPSQKRQLDDLLGSVPEAKQEDIATPEVSEKNVTTPAVPAVSEEEVAATATDAQNATSSAADNTTAKASTTASAGFHGISKHMAKLDKLPIGGLPVKRGIPTKINNEEVKAPEVKPEDIRTHPTGEEHFDAHPLALTDVEDAAASKGPGPSTAGQKGYKNMSKLDWLGLPLKRQIEDAAKAVPNVDDDALDTPEVKSSDPAVDEKKLESNTTNVNETVSAVNATGADTGRAVTDGFHQVSKHADKVPVNVGLPIKRQAPEFLSTPVDEPEVANTEADSPLHKHIVPLK